MSYKLCPSHSIYCEAKTIIRLSDGACIPMNEENTDYQEYLEWISEGNTPEEAE